MNVHVLIFSRDRALQLDATLRSFFRCAQGMEMTSITVMYRASNARFSLQYERLIREYPKVNFIKEFKFREDLIDILAKKIACPKLQDQFSLFAQLNGTRLWGRYSPTEVLIRPLMRLRMQLGRFPMDVSRQEDHWLISVDDNLFVRPFSLKDIIQALNNTNDAIGFSLRLGENTQYCYMKGLPQKPPQFERQTETNILAFNWVTAEYDFGYPLEISSSIYRSSLLLPLISSLYFNTPNSLESKMASMSKWFAKRYPKLLCYSTSVSFCNPLNKVQVDRTRNRSGNQLTYSIEELANLFDEGYRIDLSPFSGFIPDACHQEVDLTFYKP
ncbi:MAG: hypothetical protein D6735_09415 [Acidobacteria bacterium]|jgi:hypothetical protein|nr:MAG: hypothetical protein DDG59_08320 [Anaerolineae bacterium]RMG02977.1 MAG: hypothetical protein D6735_09415 [Acidobacteriota bacterium]